MGINEPEDGHNDILSFRIHASLLESDHVEQIVLPQQQSLEESMPEQAIEGKLIDHRGNTVDQISVRMESVGCSHVFRDDTNNINSPITSTTTCWRYIGSTKTSQRTFLQPTKEIKDLGSKARARLEEERMKRPEIKRLDSLPAKETQKRNRTFNTKNSSTPMARPTKKRKAAPRQAVKQRESISLCPDTSHVPTFPKESRSTLVRLHGLPVGCTIDHIKKFFVGLNPERVLILLTNGAKIAALDASSPLEANRYGARFRVLAKFESAPIAALASERSGETVVITTDHAEPKRLAIGVTQMSKEVAASIVALSIPAVSDVALETTLSVIEERLHPIVSKLLWSATAQKTGLAIDKRIQAANLMATDSDGTSTLFGYQRLAKHHNRLVDLHDQLLHQLPFPSVDIAEADYSAQNLEVRLTTAASNVIMAEMDRIEGELYRARVNRKLATKD